MSRWGSRWGSNWRLCSGGACFAGSLSSGFLFGLLCGLGGGTFLRDTALFRLPLGAGSLLRGERGLQTLFGLLLLPFAFRLFLGGERPSADEVAEHRQKGAEANHRKQGEDHQRHHENGGPERREQTREAAVHHQIAKRATRVRAEIERAEEGRNGRCCAQQLQQTGRCEEEQQKCEKAPSRPERAAQYEQKTKEERERWHNPEGEADQLVAVVGESVANHANQVGRRLRRQVERPDRLPTVGDECQKRE